MKTMEKMAAASPEPMGAFKWLATKIQYEFISVEYLLLKWKQSCLCYRPVISCYTMAVKLGAGLMTAFIFGEEIFWELPEEKYWVVKKEAKINCSSFSGGEWRNWLTVINWLTPAVTQRHRHKRQFSAVHRPKQKKPQTITNTIKFLKSIWSGGDV